MVIFEINSYKINIDIGNGRNKNSKYQMDRQNIQELAANTLNDNILNDNDEYAYDDDNMLNENDNQQISLNDCLVIYIYIIYCFSIL